MNPTKDRAQLLREMRDSMEGWVNMYLDALTDEELREDIVPGRNHGVWLLGHLIASDDDLSTYITGEPMLFPDLQESFKQGSAVKPVAEYPPADMLRDCWKAVCVKNRALYGSIDDDMLDRPHKLVGENHDADYFKTNERCLYIWILHQLHVAGQLALLLGKAGRRLA